MKALADLYLHLYDSLKSFSFSRVWVMLVSAMKLLRKNLNIKLNIIANTKNTKIELPQLSPFIKINMV